MEAILEKKKIVLVVEDDPDVNDMVCEALDDAGYKAIKAFDGMRGLQLTNEAQPDVVLMDIALPDANGIELCRVLNKDEDTKKIPIIMMTASMDLSSKLSSYIAGARRYITKPFMVEDLLHEVEKALRQKELADSSRLDYD
jgi:two-component system, OmpR family, alkaline phosphatase synthesis response regulator PhoP